MVETWDGFRLDAWDESNIGLAESCINLPSAVFKSNSTSSPFIDLYQTFTSIELLLTMDQKEEEKGKKVSTASRFLQFRGGLQRYFFRCDGHIQMLQNDTFCVQSSGGFGRRQGILLHEMGLG